jgi:hypothetical protein
MSAIADEAGKGHDHHGHHDDHGHCEPRVKVPFNNKEVFVHTGHLSVETLKRLAGSEKEIQLHERDNHV